MSSRSKRILVISDIHGNLIALEKVLKDAGEVDAVWCLGDLIGYGPKPNECIERVRSLKNFICILGNHDAAILGRIDLQAFNQDARISLRWAKSILSPDNLDYLQNLPEKVVIDKATLAHGSPRNPVWEYILDIHTALENFIAFDTPVCMVGHTQMPIAYYQIMETRDVGWEIPRISKVFRFTRKTIINPGSVGQPRDRDPRAAYAIYYPRRLAWEQHRVDYDIDAVQEQIRNNDLPFRHAARLSEGW